jgi:hypothetical protein
LRRVLDEDGGGIFGVSKRCWFSMEYHSFSPAHFIDQCSTVIAFFKSHDELLFPQGLGGLDEVRRLIFQVECQSFSSSLFQRSMSQQ